MTIFKLSLSSILQNVSGSPIVLKVNNLVNGNRVRYDLYQCDTPFNADRPETWKFRRIRTNEINEDIALGNNEETRYYFYLAVQTSGNTLGVDFYLPDDISPSNHEQILQVRMDVGTVIIIEIDPAAVEGLTLTDTITPSERDNLGDCTSFRLPNVSPRDIENGEEEMLYIVAYRPNSSSNYRLQRAICTLNDIRFPALTVARCGIELFADQGKTYAFNASEITLKIYALRYSEVPNDWHPLLPS
ncbi:MAG: hypothetical protein ACKVTZ_23420 [Bacteroidia bacterium]